MIFFCIVVYSFYRSYLTILANVQCPNERNVSYSSTMFDVVKKVYQGDVLRPDIFGSLGTIAGNYIKIENSSTHIHSISFFYYYYDYY